jgi:ssDNA-binding Zn-finger/Zn-ribbon topoisomerase 1
MRKDVSLTLKCPHCDKSLMEAEVQFNNLPSIKINIETEHDRGVLWLSSIYGSNEKKLSIDIDDSEIVDMFCPACNKELAIAEICQECSAPLVSFVIKAGGIVRVCSRKGCNNHLIVFKDVSSEMSKFYYEYGF